MTKIDGIYHVRVEANGKGKYISTGCTTRAEAEKVVAESSIEKLSIAAKAGRLTRKAIGQILTGKNLTCDKALDEYIKVKSASKSEKTVANNALVVGNWMSGMKIGALPPSAVTADHISLWINSPKLTWKRSTRQVALASVRTFFGFCSDQGWIVADPSQLVVIDYSAMTHEQKESVEKLPFTEADVKLIQDSLEVDYANEKPVLLQDRRQVLFWRVAVAVAQETGLRLSDVAQLSWRSFGEPGKLVVWTEKTNKRMEHPISEVIQNLVAEVPVSDAEFLFPLQSKTIKDVARRAALSVQFSRILDRLKIEGKSFHSFRHFRASQSYAELDKEALAAKLAESLSLGEIAGLLGHSNKSTTKGYLHA